MSETPEGHTLTDKQAAFVREYLVDLNAKAAAIRAGYSPRSAKQTASELMTLPEYAHVKDAVDVAMAQRSMRIDVSADYVIRNLTEVVDRCLQRHPVMVRDGKALVQATDDNGEGVWQFDAKGANGALTLLGKHLGMYIDKKELLLPKGTGVLAIPVGTTPEAWAEMAQRQQEALTARPAVAPEKET